jgi:hypothetical protein
VPRPQSAIKPGKTDTMPPRSNSDFPWDTFDADEYRDHNYRTLRDDDQQIILAVRDFFAGTGISGARGVDVGSGSNLYPAFSMLPFCSTIDLYEYAATNVAWLNRQTPRYDQCWDQFWAQFAANRVYGAVENPRVRLATAARVRQKSIFDLPARRWDIGTMFFVACSISADIDEFNAAVTRFVRSLKRDAPFAAGFMVESNGYDVAGTRFPAVSVDMDDIGASFAGVARIHGIQDIDTKHPLREGYGGMSLVTGWARG